MNVYILVVMALTTFTNTIKLFVALNESDKNEFLISLGSVAIFGTGLGFSIAVL